MVLAQVAARVLRRNGEDRHRGGNGPHSSPVWIAENKSFSGKESGRGDRAVRNRTHGAQKYAERERIDMATAAQTPVVFNSFSQGRLAIVGGMFTRE